MEPQDDPYPAAIALLARREHSRRELERKLRGKGFAADAVEQCLQRLQGERLQSDVRFAEAYLNSRAGKGYGPARIRAELAERGVEGEVIEQQLDEAGIDWCDLAAEVRRKKFGGRAPHDYLERARQARFLQYRGFAGEQLRSLFADDE